MDPNLLATYVNQLMIYIVFAVSLNLLQGYCGQISVAHAALGAVGGYTFACLIRYGHVPVLPALALGILAAGVVGAMLAGPALRLSSQWLILLTLAGQAIILLLVTTLPHVGGQYGLPIKTQLSLLGSDLSVPISIVPFFTLACASAFAICYRIGRSPFGRVIRAIRDDEVACRSLGKNVFRFKTIVFTITAGLAGLAGAMHVVNISVASSPLYDFFQSSNIIAMVVIGGTGNFVGSIFGVAVLLLLGPFFEHVLNFDPVSAALCRLIAFGLVLIVVLLWRPAGLLPERAARSARGGRTRRANASARATAVERDDGRPTFRSKSGSRDAATTDDLASLRATDNIALNVLGMSKRFGGIVGVDDVNMVFRRATITALVGPNGAGKTTMLDLLTGAVRPDAGTVAFGTREVAGLSSDRITRLGMARSFQSVRLFPRLTVLENVMLAVPDQRGEHLAPLFFNPRSVKRIEASVRATSLEYLSFAGIVDAADEIAGSLSLGEQKLVALARTLATDAGIILLDEPTSGVDVHAIDVIVALIEKIRSQGRTICLVEHNLQVVERLADYTYFMELGRVTAQGAYSDLKSERRLVEAYFGV